MQYEIGDGTEDGCGRDGQYPGGDHLAGYIPVDCFNALGCADAHDGAGYDVGRGYGQMQQRCAEDDDSGVEVSGEAVYRLHAEYLAADRADDLPAADGRAERHSESAEDLDECRYFQRADVAAAQKCQRDDTHGFLGIVGAVSKSHEGCRYDL